MTAGSVLPNRADMRKATRNMTLATEAIERLLDALPAGWLDAHREIPFVVGTEHGELATTIAFLETLGKTGVARPFLFQSSLHNATLGFLSQRFGLRGPGFTVCPAEDAKCLAEDLLGRHAEVLVVISDGDAASAEIVKP